jgi:hypothetical protein
MRKLLGGDEEEILLYLCPNSGCVSWDTPSPSGTDGVYHDHALVMIVAHPMLPKCIPLEHFLGKHLQRCQQSQRCRRYLASHRAFSGLLPYRRFAFRNCFEQGNIFVWQISKSDFFGHFLIYVAQQMNSNLLRNNANGLLEDCLNCDVITTAIEESSAALTPLNRTNAGQFTQDVCLLLLSSVDAFFLYCFRP